MGEKVILDNGAYEGIKLDSIALLRWVLKLRPTVVILPDVVGKVDETVVESIRFKRMLKDAEYRGQTMYVCHTDGTVLESRRSHLEGLILEADYIGLSRLVPRYTERSEGSFRRTEFIHYLRARELHTKAKYHALGMLDGNLAELPLLKAVGIHSIDSSSPIWRGLHGYSMHHKWPDYEFDPMRIPDPCNIQVAKDNLSAVLALCK